MVLIQTYVMSLPVAKLIVITHPLINVSEQSVKQLTGKAADDNVLR